MLLLTDCLKKGSYSPEQWKCFSLSEKSCSTMKRQLLFPLLIYFRAMWIRSEHFGSSLSGTWIKPCSLSASLLIWFFFCQGFFSVLPTYFHFLNIKYIFSWFSHGFSWSDCLFNCNRLVWPYLYKLLPWSNLSAFGIMQNIVSSASK